jgi:hypothetical protein
MAEHYALRQGPGLVEVWSEETMPFEPKGWRLQMRGDVRAALRATAGAATGALRAVYWSERPRGDIENLLLYNVGTTCFGRLCPRRLVFERRLAPPPSPPTPLAGCPAHYYRYSVDAEDGNTDWRPGAPLAMWDRVICPVVRSEGSADAVWWAMKHAAILGEPAGGPPGTFGLRLDITHPGGRPVNLAGVAKPLFDGVSSALHAYDGADLDDVSARLAARMDREPQAVRSALAVGRGTVLGPRMVLHTWGRTVQWNPADDLCMVGEIVAQPVHGATEWTISGSVSALLPAR